MIISGPDPYLQGEFSSEFHELLSDMLNKDPDSRPTAWEILWRPISLRCLMKKVWHVESYISRMFTDQL